MKHTLTFALLLCLTAMLGTGDCCTTVTWKYNPATRTLFIMGTGAMEDYSYDHLGNAVVPWISNRCLIETVVICDGVTHIGDLAFYECSDITSVSILSSVTDIGICAFADCSAMTSITNLRTMPQYISDYASPHVFRNVDKRACTLYVPTGSVEAYRKAEGWGEFKNIEPLSE
jgi:hypothetical protein